MFLNMFWNWLPGCGRESGTLNCLPYITASQNSFACLVQGATLRKGMRNNNNNNSNSNSNSNSIIQVPPRAPKRADINDWLVRNQVL